ncbi:UNVERIFIED_CONTAM: hypothetical protein K2H54_009972, partial [Gekko kuhli]
AAFCLAGHHAKTDELASARQVSLATPKDCLGPQLLPFPGLPVTSHKEQSVHSAYRMLPKHTPGPDGERLWDGQITYPPVHGEELIPFWSKFFLEEAVGKLPDHLSSENADD